MLFPTINKELELVKSGWLPVGVDEVGRGALAGPVVACALAFSSEFYLSLPEWALEVRDSKLLSPKKREELSEKISESALAISLASVVAEKIDEKNILQATLEAMGSAVEELNVRVPKNAGLTTVLVDGSKGIPTWSGSQIAVIKGDSKHFVISSASIIAKVYRDSLMQELHREFPQYDWIQNKGYGTKKHLDAILISGLSSHHRRTFCKRFDQTTKLQ